MSESPGDPAAAAAEPGKRTRAVLYLIASEDAEATAQNVEELRKHAVAHGFEVVGCLRERPQDAPRWPAYRRLLAAARRGAMKVVCVPMLQALCYSRLGALREAVKLDALGVRVVSMEEPWFSARSYVARWIVEGERLRHERAAKTREEKRRKGERLGQAPYGYCVGPDGMHLYMDEYEQRVIASVEALADEGFGDRAIARVLADDGFHSRAGTYLTHSQVARIRRRARDE